MSLRRSRDSGRTGMVVVTWVGIYKWVYREVSVACWFCGMCERGRWLVYECMRFGGGKGRQCL